VEAEVSEHLMNQFAQELHDNIGHSLTAMHVQIQNDKLDYPTMVKTYEPLEARLDEATQQLRLLSRTLNHDYLGHIGFQAAIDTEIQRLNTLRRFTTHLETDAEPLKLERAQELMLFRIFQEVVQNTLRHAGAKHLYIEIKSKDGFSMRVTDDGKGFNVNEALSSPKGLGLRNIQKRSRLAGMQCSIISSPGKGCTYVFEKS
jgi:two-component system, NarL family, sensor kinase